MLSKVEGTSSAVRVVIIHERRVRTSFASGPEAAAAQGAPVERCKAHPRARVGCEAVPLTSLCHAEANGRGRGRSSQWERWRQQQRL